MIKPLSLILLTFMAATAHAGSFIVNEVLYTSSHQEVFDYLKERGYKAFVLSSPEYPQITIIAEEQSDSQSDQAIETLLKDTSKKFNTVAVSYLLHDSDIVYCVGFSSGGKIYSYDSNPGYFDGTDTPPSCVGLDELSRLLGMDAKALSPFLQKEKVRSYLFADDLLVDIFESQKLPKWLAGIGFTYLKEEPEIVKWCEGHGISVKRVE